MREKIYSLFTNPSDMTWEQILMNITLAAVLGFFIFISYFISHRGTIYSKKFNASLVILTVLTGTVMTVIGNNIALSLGMVGALSIVRFRTAIKDSRDTVYIFWAIIVGICCGVGDYLVASIGSGVVFVVILLLDCIKSDNRMLFILRAERSKSPMIKSQVYKLFDGRAVLRVENTTDSSVELIYELTQKMIKKAEKKEPDITGSIYKIGGIEYVNIVMQNDEISN
ncbi:MAG: DUF4956 domain-containing protein [Emergencia sp.]|nr:DUF4956 domain-containing protein [Bacillota bacterium]